MKRIEKELASRKADVERLDTLLRAVPADVCRVESSAAFLAAMEPVLAQLGAMAARSPLPPVRAPAATAAQLDAFARWFAAHGGVLHASVAPALLPGYGAALCVARDAPGPLAADELVVRVPRALVLSEETALRAEGVAALFGGRAVAAQFPETALALQVLHEATRGSGESTSSTSTASFWAPYLAALPERYATPLFWARDDFCALRGSPALYESLMGVKAAATQYCHFFRALAAHRDLAARFVSPRLFTWPRFAWALSAVMTRKNRIPVLPATDRTIVQARKEASGAVEEAAEKKKKKNQKQEEQQEEEQEQTMVCLIPMWDLHNHEPGRITTFAVPPAGAVECRAQRAFAPGEQVFIHYGDRSNMQLLSHNGFVLTDAPNPADIVLVARPAPTDADAALRAHKAALLARLVPRAAGPYAFFVATHTGEPSPALLAAARVLALSAEDVAVLLALDSDGIDEALSRLAREPLSEAHERAARHRVAEACLRQLLAYPGRFADDCAELVAARAAHTHVHCATPVQRAARALCLLEKYALTRAAGLLRAFPGKDTLDFDFSIFDVLVVDDGGDGATSSTPASSSGSKDAHQGHHHKSSKH